MKSSVLNILAAAVGIVFLSLMASVNGYAQSRSPCATPGTCTCAQMAVDCKNYYPAETCKKAAPICRDACRSSGGKTASFVGPASGATRVARCQ
jgi:hypothetical protein